VPLPGGAKVGKNPITVHVEFRDVLDLVPQSTVKVDDVTVGRVTSVKLKGYHADVTMLLPRSVELPDNARAEIRRPASSARSSSR
jgi:phospholipid/cholesterol/gamma-HCH transport system substrate-binding protein